MKNKHYEPLAGGSAFKDLIRDAVIGAIAGSLMTVSALALAFHPRLTDLEQAQVRNEKVHENYKHVEKTVIEHAATLPILIEQLRSEINRLENKNE